MKAAIFFVSILLFLACSKSDTSKTKVSEKAFILWGSSIGSQKGETKEAAYNRVKSAFGKHQIARIYCSGDPEWPVWLPKETVVQISFKINAKDVLNGSKDAVLSNFFMSLSDKTKIYWTYFHEPEDDIRDGAFSAEEFRNAFDYIINLQKKLQKPNLIPTLCLMAYSLDPVSKRNWKDYLPQKVELISWDSYYRESMENNVAQVFNDVRLVMKDMNMPWAVAETGVNKMKKSGQVNEPMDLEFRKKMLTALSNDLSNQQPYPVFVAYFDSDPPQDATYSDWRISDDPDMVAAWNNGQQR